MREIKIAPGITEVQFSKKDTLEMHRDMAKARGLTLRQFRAQLKAEGELWCSCEEPGDVLFCNDGQRRNKFCVQKHHYHCSKCGKITQVG